MLMSQNEAIIEAFQALGGIRGIAEITSWINERYGNQWKGFGTVMADMVPRSHGGNASSLEPKHFRVLERVKRGKYRLLNY